LVQDGYNWVQKLIDEAYLILTDIDLWVKIGLATIKIVLIFLVARLIVSIVSKAVVRVFNERVSGPISISEKRSKTLSSLINNIVKNVVYFVAIMLILGELNFQLAPLLAGAGVLGLAIGFGAQNLVRDVITGFFIVYEDQFAVGDFIATSGVQGTVQEIGLRITKIKEWTGQVHILPNGSITQVTNFSKENSIAVLDIGIAYEANISKAEEVLQQVLMEWYEQEENMVAPPEVMGVQSFGASDVVLRASAECKPMTHWAIGRKLRKAIKDRFDQEGIEIPYPRLVTYHRQE